MGRVMMRVDATLPGIDFRIGRAISNADVLINPKRLAAIQKRNALVGRSHVHCRNLIDIPPVVYLMDAKITTNLDNCVSTLVR